MKFNHHKLDHLSRGDRVEITLQGNAANVRLMNNSNFQAYKNGRKHKYYGGLVNRSPFFLTVPSSGQWNITVDMLGLRGQVRSSVRVLPNPLPEARESPLNSVPSLVQDNIPPSTETQNCIYDVFISHASEDKDDIVRSLATALINQGLRVWYDEFSLKIGDSLRQKIDKGLASSLVGLVVLSPSFISKGWANYELDGIVTRTTSGEQILLPIWHNITKQEVIDYSPSLADKVARSTSTHTVEEIASEIADLIKTKKK